MENILDFENLNEFGDAPEAGILLNEKVRRKRKSTDPAFEVLKMQIILAMCAILLLLIIKMLTLSRH